GIRDATVTGVQTCALPISPKATCRRVERRWTGSGISRIARTMFSLDTRQEAIAMVAMVMRNPMANPLIRSESVHERMNPVPPNRSEERRVGKEDNAAAHAQ